MKKGDVQLSKTPFYNTYIFAICWHKHLTFQTLTYRRNIIHRMNYQAEQVIVQIL